MYMEVPEKKLRQCVEGETTSIYSIKMETALIKTAEHALPDKTLQYTRCPLMVDSSSILRSTVIIQFASVHLSVPQMSLFHCIISSGYGKKWTEKWFMRIPE